MPLNLPRKRRHVPDGFAVGNGGCYYKAIRNDTSALSNNKTSRAVVRTVGKRVAKANNRAKQSRSLLKKKEKTSVALNAFENEEEYVILRVDSNIKHTVFNYHF
jgi:hypothetical protein